MSIGPAPARYRALAVGLSAGLLTVLAACTPGGPQAPTGPGAETTTSPAGTEESGGETPSGAGGLLECGQEVKDSLGDVDLESVTWSTPADFYESDDFVSVNDYEEQNVELWVASYEGPEATAASAIAVTFYPEVAWGDLVVGGCAQIPIEAALARVAEYWEVPGTTDVPVGESEIVRIGGQPAIAHDFTFEGTQAHGWWLYSNTQLLHLQCQWVSEAERPGLEAGCDQFLESVVIP
ncbi:hypothetical protein [Occultella gossypii]|uniref:DUF3558 domain-containing protein n=1 Tax=Occultella gossypii TaxID=2800820 RepID=A0ABS7S3I0_9MICO|nr:hypothetical protein [Occultella gossypii]MBZ2194652.1 hypothetical protein [Occultella gossypii]